jgi:hypothetical protein
MSLTSSDSDFAFGFAELIHFANASNGDRRYNYWGEKRVAEDRPYSGIIRSLLLYCNARDGLVLERP